MKKADFSFDMKFYLGIFAILVAILAREAPGQESYSPDYNSACQRRRLLCGSAY